MSATNAAGRIAERLAAHHDRRCPACLTFAMLADTTGAVSDDCPMCGNTGLLGPASPTATFDVADIAELLAALAERDQAVAEAEARMREHYRPALRALAWWAEERRVGTHNWLTWNGLSTDLADECIAATEAE